MGRFDNWDFYIEYGEARYSVSIDKEKGIIIGGCDCEETMDDETALKVFEALGNYLHTKRSVNEEGEPI